MDMPHEFRSISCTDSFALFLIYIYQRISLDYYRELCIVLVILREWYNKEGPKAAKKFHNKRQEEYIEDYADEEDADLLPDNISNFVVSDLPQAIDKGDLLTEDGKRMVTVMGKQRFKISRGLFAIKYICSWLYLFGHTEVQLNFRKEP